MKILFFIILFILLSFTLYATIINVPADQPTIQAGIDAAAETDTVLVAPGTYFESINFTGKNIFVSSWYITAADSNYIDQTIINGNQTDRIVSFESGEDSTAVLCGFTLENGSSTEGGAIYCEGSSPTLDHLLIKNCYANRGGAIFLHNASPNLINCSIVSNLATYGGSIYLEAYSHPDLLNTIMWCNSPEEIYCSEENFLLLQEIPDITVNESDDHTAFIDLNDYIVSSTPIEDLIIDFTEEFSDVEGEVTIDEDFFLTVDFFPALNLVYHTINSVDIILTVEDGSGQVTESFTVDYTPAYKAVQGNLIDVYTYDPVTDFAVTIVNGLEVVLFADNEFIAFFELSERPKLQITKTDYYESIRLINDVSNDDLLYNFSLVPIQYDEDYEGDWHEDGFSRVFRGWTGGGITRWEEEAIFCVDDTDSYGYNPNQNDFDKYEITLGYINEFTNGLMDPLDGDGEHLIYAQDGFCNPDLNSEYGYAFISWDPGLASPGVHFEVFAVNGLTIIKALTYIEPYNVNDQDVYNQEVLQNMGAKDDIDQDFETYFGATYWPPGESTFCDSSYCSTSNVLTDFDKAWGKRAYMRSVGNLMPDEDPEPAVNDNVYTEVFRFFIAYGLDGRKFQTYQLLGYAPKGMIYHQSEIVDDVPAGAALELTPVNGNVMNLTPANYSTFNKRSLPGNSQPDGIQYDLDGNLFTLTWKSIATGILNKKEIHRDRINIYMSKDHGRFQRIAEVNEDIFSMQLAEPGIYRFYVDAEYNGNEISYPSGIIEFAYNTSDPVYYKKLCYKSAPKLHAAQYEDIIDLSWDVLPSGVYGSCDSSVMMHYDKSELYLSINGSKSQKVYEGELTDYFYVPSFEADYRFMVKAYYNNSQVTPNSNTTLTKFTLGSESEQTDLVQVYKAESDAITQRVSREIDLNSITINYSDVEGGEANIITNNMADIYWQEGNLEEDPLFDENYHLTENSPCIDAGDPSFPLDPNNTIADMGAFYYPDQGIVVEEIYPEPGELTISEGDSINFYITAYDPDGEELEYSWKLDNEEVSIDSSYTFFTDENSAGNYNVTLNVTDNFSTRENRNTLNFNWNVIVENVSSPEELLPIVTAIYQNVPNPFNPETTIRFDLSKTADVRLDIYNTKGQKVKTLVNQQLGRGNHTFIWNGNEDNGSPVASGVYFYKLKAGEFEQVRKMLVLK